MEQQLIDLYHRHVGMAFDRQQRFTALQEKLKAADEWEYDAETATLSFGPKIAYEAPILGSHVSHNDSWLWAWSDRHTKLTLTNRALGDAVRAIAHRLGLHVLATPGFPLEPLLGPELTLSAPHVLGTVLGAELGFDAYFVFSDDASHSLVLIRDDRLHAAEKHPLRRILTVFPELFRAMPVFDHRAAFRGYADDYGLTAVEDGGRLRLTAGKDHVLATFDTQGQLATLEGTMKPENPPAKKVAARAKGKGKAAKKLTAKTTKKPATPAKTAAKKPAGKKPTRPAATVVAKKPAAKKPGKKR